MATEAGGRPVNRIMIIGQPGSGKSTLAQALGIRTGLPVIHIDRIHWQPGWVERSREEKTRLCREAERGEQWIFEGGHSPTWPSRLAHADMLVCLERPVGLRLWRVLRRAVVGYGRTRPDMAENCPERLRYLGEFGWFIWTTRRSARVKMARLASHAPGHCEVVYLRSDAEVAAFLTAFER